MKINQIIVSESMGGTTAGAVATVESPLGVIQKRSPVAGLQPAEKVMKGKAKKKGPYQNSIVEGKKDFLGKLQKNVEKANKAKKDTEEKVKKHQDDQNKKKVDEAKLDEDDIIVVPGQKMKRKTGFVPQGQSRVDHEVEMARSDVLAAIKNAKAIYSLLKDRSEEEGLEGWVQEKLIKANDYLNAVKEYYDEKMMQEMGGGGVITAGGVGESVKSIPKLPRRHFFDTWMAGTTGNGIAYTDNKNWWKIVDGKVVDFTNSPEGTKEWKREFVAKQKEGVAEGAKVDRMVKHIAKSEREAGKSSKEAENIAWATVNKRGYLDNKNKKKKKD